MGNTFLRAHMCWFMIRTFLAFKDVFLTKMGLYLLGGILAIKNMATVPVLLAFIEYYGDFVNRLLSVTDNILKRGNLEESARRVREIMELTPPQKPYRLEHFEQLELKDISFSYGEEEGYIFRGFDMVVRKGESIVVAGESGKSTLIETFSNPQQSWGESCTQVAINGVAK